MPDQSQEKPKGTSGKITFYEFFEPPLESGDYEVTVNQSALSTDPDPKKHINETFSNQMSFTVLGPRLSLPTDYFHTVFPQPNGQGEYSNVLPHIVFAVKTLPWQRDPGMKSATGKPLSWLAVLVFDKNDPIPELKTGTLADLTSKVPDKTFCYPGFDVEYGEKDSDPIQYIDIPATTFLDIAPTVNDLPWISHSRILNSVTNRCIANGQPPGVEYSVVVGNRLPIAGSETSCFLVSIENIGEYLNGGSKTLPTDNESKIRLAVLHSWSFASVKEKETFREYLENVNKNPSTPQIPYPKSENSGDESVKEAFSMGYSAINHHTRQGANTVSWYRGPFLPFQIKENIKLPVPSADSILKYNPETGMFDVSLATAWQIGRLLALNNKTFSNVLYNWKRKNELKTVNEFEKEFIAGELNIDPNLINSIGKKASHQIISNVIKPMLKDFLSKTTEHNE